MRLNNQIVIEWSIARVYEDFSFAKALYNVLDTVALNEGEKVEIHTSRTIQSLSPVKYTNELFDTNDYSNRTPIDKIQLAALSKFDSWEYENEWRLISFIKEEQRFQLIKPTAVIFGTKTLKENKEWISKICEERGIPTKQAELSRTEYKLHII